MVQTIYATFPTEREAERAAGALMDHGVSSSDISFIVPDRLEPVQTDFAGGLIPTGPDSSTPLNAPASYRSAVPAQALDAPPVPNLSGALAGGPVVQSQDVSAAPSRPGYVYDALGDEIPDPTVAHSMARRDPALDEERIAEWRQDPTFAPPSTLSDAGAHLRGVGSARTTLAADMPIDTVEADHGHIVDNNREMPTAASGITTSTGRDAARGAAEGAGIGLGLGLVLGLAAVLVPGVGLVAGAGALIASLTAATAVAGGVAGGVYGYLTDLGLPPDTARNLDSHLKAGGPILSVHLSGSVAQSEIVMLLEKYGATSAEAF
jgi:hypothetical protein